MSNLLKAVSYKKGAAINVGATLVWKLLSFVNAVLIAAMFAKEATDIYFYAGILGGIAVYFFTDLNSAVIIPEAMHKEKRERTLFLNRFIAFYFLAGALMVLISFLPPLKEAAFGRFAGADIYKGHILQLAAIYFSLFLFTQFLLNILETEKYFALAFISPLNAVLPLLFLLTCGKTYGVEVMFWGFIAAQTLTALACLYVMFAKMEWNFSFKSAGAFNKNFFKSAIAVSGINLGSSAAMFLPVYLISLAAGGFVSALNYAKQLYETPVEIVSQRITAVTRISLNSAAARGKTRVLNKLLRKNLFWLCVILAPVAAFTSAFARDIVELFFKRGMFDETAAERTAMFLRLFMPYIVLSLPSTLHRTLASAEKKMSAFVRYQLLSLLIFIFFILVYMNIFGPYVYPMASLTSSILWYFIAAVMFKKLFPHIKYLRSLVDLFTLCAVSALALIPAVLAAGFIEGLLSRLLFCGIIFLFFFCLGVKLRYRRITLDNLFN